MQGTIFLIVLIIVYFVPTIVAGIRRRPDFWFIFMFNLLAGWTLIGWIASLIWPKPTEQVLPGRGVE